MPDDFTRFNGGRPRSLVLGVNGLTAEGCCVESSTVLLFDISNIVGKK